MGGGIGTRFWPISRETRPKQFLDFFGVGRSLLQMTVDRFAKVIPFENIYIVTNMIYADLVKEQLPALKDNQILLEPARRNTAPCIAYAAYHIKARNPDANIIVTPSDHLIFHDEQFIENVKKGLEFVSKKKALVTFGIIPSRPETSYGYIQSSDIVIDDFIKIKTFTEKPNEELAKVFLKSGEFFWNSGMFFWNIDTILEAIKKYLPDISARFDIGINLFNTPEEKNFIEANFSYCPSISIDYGIMEKADNVFMLAVDFGWADLGTWSSVYDVANKVEANNAILKSNALCYESENNIIVLEGKDRIAVVQGLKDYIIAESGNVLMICKRKEEGRIKQYMADAYIKFGEKFK